MKQSPFTIKSLTIYSMPGFPRGMKKYSGFSAMINLIAGPNASGKTSTADVMRKLIWRTKTENIRAEGKAEAEGVVWDIKLDNGRVSVQGGGQERELRGLPSSESQDRYVLSLHRLVHDNEEELAREIFRESIGGYDLDKAAETLNYSANRRIKSSQPYQDFIAARKRYDEARRKQEALYAQEERLTELRRQKEEAALSARRKELFDRAADWLRSRQSHRLLSDRYERFNPRIYNKMTGEELENINNLEKEIHEVRLKKSDTTAAIENANSRLANISIAGGEIGEDEFSELDDRLLQLENLESSMRDKKQRLSDVEMKASETLKELDESLDPSEWEGVDLHKVYQLDRFYREASEVYHQKHALEARLKSLKPESEKTEHEDPEQLSVAIRALSSWLTDQKSSGSMSAIWLLIVTLIGIAGAVLAAWTGFTGAGIAAVVLIAFAVAAYFLNPSNPSEVRQEDFRKSRMTPPDHWDVPSVTEKLEELIKRQSTTYYYKEINKSIAGLQRELKALQPRIDSVNSRYKELKDLTKALPGLPDDRPPSFTDLHWFLESVKTWQGYHREVRGLQEQIRKEKEDYEAILKRFNRITEPYIPEHACDLVHARRIKKKLSDEEQKRRDAEKDLRNAGETVKEQDKVIKKKEAQYTEIFEKLEVPVGRKDDVRVLLNDLEAFQEVKKERNTESIRLEQKKVLLQEHPEYDAYKEVVESLTADKAEERAVQEEAKAAHLDDLREKITQIETNIERTKEGHELMNCLTELENKKSELQQVYEAHLSATTGSALVEALKNRAGDHNQPDVFRRANSLFSRITQGRYELKLDEQSGSAFRAYDHALSKGQSLGELSTGTRIQLLLSVRLAFIEQQETWLRLPLMADELLANSDDVRARAIIDALTEISRDGRQVFYFTAQSDELNRWKAALDGKKDIELRTYILGGSGESSDAKMENAADFSSLSFQFDVPSVDGRTAGEYARLIEVPLFDPLTQDAGALHLWYMITDLTLLRRCLQRGISRWGALENYLKHGGQIEGMDEAIQKQLADKARLLGRFQEEYNTGRPRPVDRQVLSDSGAVSEKFIDAVSDRCESLGNNPEKLIRALRDNEVKGFRLAKIDELEGYLKEKGYIDTRPSKTREEILSSLQAVVSTSGLTPHEAEAFINGVLSPHTAGLTSKER